MLTQKLKTHQRMPPQSAALKGRSADKTRVPSRNGTGRDAACQRGREERTGPVSPVPPPTRECGESVSSFKENACSPKHKRENALVFVLGRQGNSLMPCSPKRARKLLESKRALVACETPFTIRIKDRKRGATQPIQLKIDPGSKITGIALIRESEVNPEKQTVLYLAEVKHRSETVHNRPKRFENRTREEGWLPPSLRSRIDNITTWTDRFRCIAPITGITVENVKFDMQLMQDPEIGATLYQQGTLHGYEVREFLLEKWGRTCAYCDQKDVPLQVEHIVPLARNGSKGMPKGYLIRKKKVFGFQTKDTVEALVPSGKKAGKYVGRVAIRASLSFNIQTYTETVQGISWKYCTLCSHADGYSYSLQKTNTLTPNPNGARFIPDLKDGVATCHI